jgi:hypothetical protein
MGLVLHVHRLLFCDTEGTGRAFKKDDNLVVDRQADGSRVVRFEPVSSSPETRLALSTVLRLSQFRQRRFEAEPSTPRGNTRAVLRQAAPSPPGRAW